MIDNNENIWFNASDIAISLDYKEPKKAIQKHVDSEDKIKLDDINAEIKLDGHPHSIYINESGLYALIYASKMKKAKKFKHWVTSEVLPTVRKYNYVELRQKYDDTMKSFGDKIEFLKKQNMKMKNDLINEKYPDGALFYVLDYTDDNLDIVEGKQRVYRIGIADDMKSRKALYDTHMLHKKKAVICEEFKNPAQFEICMKSALFEYKYKARKDFYICTKKVLFAKFEKCKNMLVPKKGVQKGGGSYLFQDDITELKEQKKELALRIKIIDELVEKIDKGVEPSDDE